MNVDELIFFMSNDSLPQHFSYSFMKTNSGFSMQEHQPNNMFSRSAIKPLVLPTQEPSNESGKDSKTDSLPAILKGNVKSDVPPYEDGGEGKESIPIPENIPIPPTLPTILERHLKEPHRNVVVNLNENKETRSSQNR